MGIFAEPVCPAELDEQSAERRRRLEDWVAKTVEPRQPDPRPAVVRGAIHCLRPLAGLLPTRINRALGLWWEPRYWERALDGPYNVQYRLNPDLPLTEHLITDRLSLLPASISILDVGAGPLTRLGKKLPGRQVQITAIDPLADAYARILADRGFVAPVPTETCSGEQLRDRFAEQSFDVVYATNALDHSPDPLPIIENMLALTKCSGFVALRHARREGQRRAYTLLHQWNFDLDDSGDPIIWNRRVKVNLKDHFAHSAQTEAFVEYGSLCVILRPTRHEDT